MSRGRLTASTSAAGVENVLALAYGCARVATILQMLPSLPRGMEVSQNPRLYLVLWLLAAANAAGAVTVAVLRRRGLSPAVVVVDVALCTAFLVLGTLAVPVQDRVGTWVGWAPGYSLAVVVGVAGLSTAAWCTAVATVTAAYVFFIADATAVAGHSTIAGNTLTLLGLGGVARIVVRYIRRVAADADAARARVAELARHEEKQRAQLTMHDAITIMHLLTDPALPADTRAQLCEQAAAEIRRMRAYLRGGPGAPHPPGTGGLGRDGDVTLRDVLEEGMSGFADLGLEPALELADGVRVNADAGEAVRGAVAGVLHNVRRHARATMVIVHADAERDRARWVVTIRDNGIGFDTATTALGTGLRRQLLAELERHALTASIASAPGLGTRITIEGNLRP
ncbi:ATP-binding protein [Streptomyces sp. SID8352]|uniref:ATP-binding protein n=1 Tax=Streptomyces sp. SID8352 TaxID=2690338 RepID=UPI00136C3555|nr:ATP-binding protein [Streptomyces sp. SID8352]MYU22525.1 ATP-binding protein [Streptomyces sp. SID8352]